MNKKLTDGELSDLFDDIRQTCGDCEHPRCLGTVKSAMTLILKDRSALLEQIEGELPENKKVPEQRHAGGYSDLQTLCEQHNVIGYNEALGEIRKILESHKQQVDGERGEGEL